MGKEAEEGESIQDTGSGFSYGFWGGFFFFFFIFLPDPYNCEH